MKLHWSPRSPYVRKVMIAAHEVGIEGAIKTVRTVVSAFAPNKDIFRDNPLGRLPTLVLDDGTSIYDSHVICEYFDTLHHGPRLFPEHHPARLITLRREALGDGFLDLLVPWFAEGLKPPEQRNRDIAHTNAVKFAHIIDGLEREAEGLARDPFDIGHIAIGTALSYADFRFKSRDWREGHDAIARWHKSFTEHPSVRAVPVVDDL